MDTTLKGQVSGSAAEIYDSIFVPSIFRPWAKRLADTADLRPGQTVLDVACGTGVLALEAARRVGNDGAVHAIDRNDGMLAVARKRSHGVQWRQGRAESLPYDDGTFDAVFAQFGLMFFTDQVQALREMHRVAAPGGSVVVSVWDVLERSPGYAALAALVERVVGENVAAELRAPFGLGHRETLRGLYARAGLPVPEIKTVDGEARYASLDTWLQAEVKGWTLDAIMDDAQFDQLKQEARSELALYVQPDGSIAFPFPAHIVQTHSG